MAQRSQDWWKQAQRDLDTAAENRANDRHEWACFAAHQAAEKAVKALHLAAGQEAWGHVVARLLTELPTPAPKELVESGRVLDNFYVPARYPNGHAEGAPFEHYGPIQSELALSHARHIFNFVDQALAER
ncbi:MAG: HEPN domain-containing protein [Holophagales bacterium]|nr:HEPN domain-containing protein [Holophagales bacterium]MYF96499.1 HEPN domain-containing protein [Holophagales bacterium]